VADINMIKRYIKKVITIVGIVISITALNPSGVSADWKQEDTGSRYIDGNSYVTGWKNIDNNWYYFDNNGYMKKGWISDNGIWYYLYDNGQRATLEVIDGYFVNSSGIYTNTITASEARQLISKEDSNYISKITDHETRLSTEYREYSADNMPASGYWNIPKEPCYEFYVHVYDVNGEVLCDICEYLVGKESKSVYIAPNQGGMSIYQIKNNQKVNIFKYIGEGNSYEWR